MALGFIRVLTFLDFRLIHFPGSVPTNFIAR